MKIESATREELVRFVEHHTTKVKKAFTRPRYDDGPSEHISTSEFLTFNEGEQYHIRQDVDGVFVFDDSGEEVFLSYLEADKFLEET